MNIILCSKKYIDGNIVENMNTIIDMLQKPQETPIDFILFGEAFLNGFDGLSWNPETDKTQLEKTMKAVKVLGEMAKQYHRGLGFGYFELVDDLIYSSYIVYDNLGNVLHNYRRVSTGWRHKDVDATTYSEGTNISGFYYQGFYIGVALCGDIWYDKHYTEIQNNDFDILIWPVYVSYSKKDWINAERNQYLDKSKRLASHILYINSVSDEPAYGGTYYQANGELIEETLPSSIETCLVVTIKEN